MEIIELADRRKVLAAVDEFAVDLVADDVKIMLLGEVRDGAELLRGQHDAGGVAGVREHDRAGVLVIGFLELVAEGVAVAALGGGGDGVDNAAGALHEGIVIGVEGLGDDDLAAGIEYTEHQHLQRFAAAGGDQDLVLLVVDAEFIVIMLDRLDQHGHTGGSGVCEDGIIEIVDRVIVVRRGLNIGLADVEMVDGLALIFGFDRIGMEFAHRREVAGLCFFRDLHFAPPKICCSFFPRRRRCFLKKSGPLFIQSNFTIHQRILQYKPAYIERYIYSATLKDFPPAENPP